MASGSISRREYRIGELAKLSGLPVSTLRYWERRGFLGGRRSAGGQRVFDDRDLAWALQARDLSQRRHMTEKLADTIAALVEASEQPVRITDPIPPRALRGDANYEKMLDLAAQNARLFAEQRELAKELAAAELRYTSFAERIAECLWTAEMDDSGAMTVSLCTPAITSITGYPVEFFLGQPDPWLQVVHPQDKARVEQAFEDAVSGAAIAVEYRIATRAGAERWVRNAVTPSTDESRRFVRLDGMLSDVTERKLAEMAVRESEQELRLILENFPDIIYTQDLNLVYTSVVNPPIYQRDEVLGHTDTDLVPPDQAEFLTQVKRSVIESGETARVEYSGTLRGEERHYELTVSPLRTAVGEIEGVAAYARDITARVRAAETLRQSESLHRRLLEISPWAICAIDSHWDVVFVNPAFAAVLGWEEGPVRQQRPVLALLDESQNLALRTALQAMSSNGILETSLTVIRRDGVQVPLAARTIVVPGKQPRSALVLIAAPHSTQHATTRKPVADASAGQLN